MSIFGLERAINGLTPDQAPRRARQRFAPPVNELIAWMKQERRSCRAITTSPRLSITCSMRIDAFYLLPRRRTHLHQQQRRPNAHCAALLLKKAWLFAGSDRGGERAAVMLTLIQTAKLNDVDPQAWLAGLYWRGSPITRSTICRAMPELAPRTA